MIEITVLNYLKSVLSVPVFMEKPTDQSIVEYVILEKTGGGRINHLDSAVIVIQSHATSLYDAAFLNDEVKEAMLGNGVTTYGITADTDISKCGLNSDYNFTDLTTKSYRYQAVFDLVF